MPTNLLNFTRGESPGNIHAADYCLALVYSGGTHVCHLPASGWCPSCDSCSSFLLPQFFTRLSLVDRTSAFPLGSSGLQLWWWSWDPCAACAQSSAITSWCWWSLYLLAGAMLRGHGWRWFLAKRCFGFFWDLSCEKTTACQGRARLSMCKDLLAYFSWLTALTSLTPEVYRKRVSSCVHKILLRNFPWRNIHKYRSFGPFMTLSPKQRSRLLAILNQHLLFSFL